MVVANHSRDAAQFEFPELANVGWVMSEVELSINVIAAALDS